MTLNEYVNEIYGCEVDLNDLFEEELIRYEKELARIAAKESTREEVLNKLYGMALELSKKYSYATNYKMWTLCSDWNSDHEDEEIFMCEDEDENGKYRFYIEDDYFYLGE